jgi:ELWxxDGT repeat protein
LYFDGYTPVVLGSSQGRSWFLAYSDGESSGELWMTDGTPAGTRRIAGQTAGVGFLDGRAYFGLFGTDAYASELWTADGPRSSVGRVTTLKRIPPSSDPVFVPLGKDAALFEATEGERSQLWRSDGTPEGTALVTGFRGIPYGPFTPLGGLYVFTVYKEDPDGNFLRDELWRTDGTRSGTRKMVTFAYNQFPDTSVAKVWNGKYLFPVDDSPGNSPEVSTCSYWISDGTAAGTRQIVPPLAGVRLPTGLHPFGSHFLFVARKEAKGGPVPQIFVSDGTPAGTRQLTNNRGTREPLETEVVQLGRTVFFRIYGLDGGLAGEPEVWRTDGTPKGTRRAFDLKAAAHLQVLQGSLYLTAALGSEPGARGLFRVDHPQASPVLIAPVSPPYRPDLPDFLGVSPFTPVGGRLFFSGGDSGGGDAGGRELWVTDGTAAGTKRVLDVRPGPGSSEPDGLTAAGDRVFFAADDGVHGRELWVSDGTAAGTHLVWDVNPGEASSNPQSLVVSGGNLFFGADDGETGWEPWVLRLER